MHFRLRWIARLRRADLSLAEIREILQVEDLAAWPVHAVEKVCGSRADALAELAQMDAVLGELEALSKAAPRKARRLVG